MLFELRRIRREGWAIPRYRHALHGHVVGELQVEDVFDERRRRYSRVARLLDPTTRQPIAEVPPLWDAQLVSVRPGQMTLSGLEVKQDGARDIVYAQSWLLEPAAAPESKKPGG